MKKAVVIPMGVSPAVATEMVRYLETDGLTDVVLLPTKNKKVLARTRLVETALKVRYPTIRVHIKVIPIDDVTDEIKSIEVMKYVASAICQEKVKYHIDTLYLSISGGRKDMSVISTIIGLAFGVAEIYHVIHREIQSYSIPQEAMDSLMESFIEEDLQKRIGIYIKNIEQLNELLFPPGDVLSFVRIPVIPYPQEYISLLKRILKPSGAYFADEDIDPILLEMLRRVNLIQYNEYRVWPTEIGLEIGKMLRCEV